MKVVINAEVPRDVKLHMNSVWHCIFRNKDRETFTFARFVVTVEKTADGYVSSSAPRAFR